MTCATTRQRLLHSERLDRPPADVQPHLADCADCRAWQRRLTRIERQIAEIPLPASAPPPDLLRQIRNGPPPLPVGPIPGINGGSPPWWVAAAEADRQRPFSISPRQRPDPTPRSHNERGRRKVAVAFALTLGLAVFSLCWGVWPHPPSVTPPTLVHYSMRAARLERLLATARTPKERVLILADFSGDLRREALALIDMADSEELPAVAALYVHVVRERLPTLARSVPQTERAEIVGKAVESLRETESQLTQFLTAHPSHPAAESLRDIARAASAGQERLWALLREV